jgi:hypothetical protein
VTNTGEDPGASGAEEKMDGVQESEANTLAKSSMSISSYREEETRLGLKGHVGHAQNAGDCDVYGKREEVASLPDGAEGLGSLGGVIGEL